MTPFIPGMIYKGEQPVMQIVVAIERNEDGKFTAYCEELNCVADGDTKEEALENLRETVIALLEIYGDEIRAKAEANTTYEIITV